MVLIKGASNPPIRAHEAQAPIPTFLWDTNRKNKVKTRKQWYRRKDERKKEGMKEGRKKRRKTQ